MLATPMQLAQCRVRPCAPRRRHIPQPRPGGGRAPPRLQRARGPAGAAGAHSYRSDARSMAGHSWTAWNSPRSRRHRRRRDRRGSPIKSPADRLRAGFSPSRRKTRNTTKRTWPSACSDHGAVHLLAPADDPKSSPSRCCRERQAWRRAPQRPIARKMFDALFVADKALSGIADKPHDIRRILTVPPAARSLPARCCAPWDRPAVRSPHRLHRALVYSASGQYSSW